MADEQKAPEVKAPGTKTVEYERFRAVTKDRDEWKGKYETEIQPLAEKAAKVDSLVETLDKIKVEHKSALASAQEELSLVRAGVVDAEDADLVRFHYGRLTGEGKPKTVVDFVTGLKAEGATVPKGLGHIFGKPADPPAKGDGKGAAGDPPPKAPKAPGGGDPPPANGTPTAAAIIAATQAWQRNPTAENRKVLEDLSARRG